MFQHLFRMEVRDQKRNVVSLMHFSIMSQLKMRASHLHGFPSQDEERFRSLGQESCEFVDQNVLNLICLLDADAHANAIHAWFNQNFLILVPGYSQRIQ